MTINVPAKGSWTWEFVLYQSGDGRIIPYQQGEGWGAGTLYPQDTSAFNINKLVGTYVFDGIGADKFGLRAVEAGEMAFDGAGNVNAIFDVSGNGNWQSGSFAGSFGSVDSTGRFTGQVTDNKSKVGNVVAYVISPTHFVYALADNVQTGPPLLAGQGHLQSGSGQFSNASLSGNVVVYDQGIHLPGDGGAAVSGIVLAACDGQGGMSYVRDENSGGTLTNSAGSTTYSMSSNGRGTFLGGDTTLVIYLVAPNRGIYVGGANDYSSSLGLIEPQAPRPYSNASFAGNYVAGSLAPASYGPDANPEVDVASADGAGTLTITGESYGGNTLDRWTNQKLPFNVVTNGRFTSPDGSVGYMISPDKVRILSGSSYPNIMSIAR
jgi:hypothetical protein